MPIIIINRPAKIVGLFPIFSFVINLNAKLPEKNIAKLIMKYGKDTIKALYPINAELTELLTSSSARAMPMEKASL